MSQHTYIGHRIARGLVTGQVVLAAWGLGAGPALAEAPKARPAALAKAPATPGQFLAFKGSLRDLAVCGQTLAVAMAPTADSGPDATGFIRCPREGHPEHFPLTEWRAEQQAVTKLHLAVHVFLQTPAPMREALRHCMRSRGAHGVFRVVATDGVDRALVADGTHFHLVRVAATQCSVLQRWRIPPRQINFTDAKMVKSGAYVIVSNVDGPGDDKASLYLIKPDGVQHVLDGAVTLDMRPNLRDSRAVVVVARSPKVDVRTSRGLKMSLEPPWLGLEIVDGARRVTDLGSFRQYEVDGVLVRSNPDLSLIAVARFGGLLPTVVLMGEKACQAPISVLNSRGQVPTGSETTSSVLLGKCSTAALTMPHR